MKQLDIKNESIKDMNINKKIYKREVARQVFIFSYQNTNTISSQVISLLGNWS